MCHVAAVQDVESDGIERRHEPSARQRTSHRKGNEAAERSDEAVDGAAHAENRIRGIVERDEEMSARPQRLVQLSERRDDVALVGEVVECRRRENHVERAGPQGEPPHVRRTREDAVAVRVHGVDGAREDAWRHVHQHARAEAEERFEGAEAARFLERIGLQ